MARIAMCLLLASAAGCHSTDPPVPALPVVPHATAAAPLAGQVDSPSVVGVWRGTSKCTVRPSPCNDEIVVYHVAGGAGPDDVVVQANKLVDGQEQEMGTLPCQLQRAEHQLACTIEKGVFRFTIDGDRIHGTLDLTDGTLYRRIEVERVR
jgi:hypothetical protein